MAIRYSSSGGTPFGGTSDRPSSPLKGQTFYNGDTGILEIYTGSVWRPTNIPFGNNAGRPSSPQTGQPYFNGESQRLELYTGATFGWQNIVAETPGVTGYTGTITETTGGTITITGTNFASGSTASIIGTDGTEYLATTTTVSNLTQIVATFGSVSGSLEPYDLKVTNPSNLYGVYYDILTVNDKPIWQTAAGSLGTFNEQTSISVTVTATDEENNTITYSVASGSSLPSGITLNSSTGVISGTLPDISADTTYTFTINASDGSNAPQGRVFSITSKAQVLAETLLVAGGGSGGGIGSGFQGQRAAGGGAGGLIYISNFPFIVGNFYTLTIGNGGSNNGNGTARNNGQNSVLSGSGRTLTALGGGAGGSDDSTANGNSGGSGGGQWYPGYTGAAATQPANTNDGITTWASTGFGNKGGDSSSAQPYGSGGGGAGAAGGNWNSVGGPQGGIGKQYSITGTATYYAGGGGAAGYPGASGYLEYAGGLGGGGTGSNDSFDSISNGTANTGGGGGSGGAGGSGVIILAYPDTFPAITSIPGTLTYNQPTRSGYRVYRFTGGTGTITF